jgi:FKBP-type peptidyl-prolyl cis-trans isomerase (trigger factor)
VEEEKCGTSVSSMEVSKHMQLVIPASGGGLQQVSVLINADLVSLLFDKAAKSQLAVVRTIGFNREIVPITYIKNHFRNALIDHVKEFLLKFGVVDFLYNELYNRKIAMAGEPVLQSIFVKQSEPAEFIFQIHLVDPISFIEWKNLPFKAPKRKNYKDLDRQVAHLIAEEQKHGEGVDASLVCAHDWVYFTISLVTSTENDAIPLNGVFWLKMSDEEVDNPLRDLFIGQKLGAVFTSDNKGLQEFFSGLLNTDYLFNIQINDIVNHKYVCFDQFKHYFKIKTQKDMHKKFIEIFSFRNDICQRRAIVEESLALLLERHKFFVPELFLERQKNTILAGIRENPDYNVYRRQPDFQMRIHELAVRQVKEMMLIDQMIHHESIQVSHDDVKGYLNLLKRPRTKEFLYFDIPSFQKDGQPVPVSVEQLKHSVLREKAVNYIIYHLTKK